MQSQIEGTVTNGSPNSSKESSLRPLSPIEQTKENGINHVNGSTNGSNGSNGSESDGCNQTIIDSSQVGKAVVGQNGSGNNHHDNEITKENETKENSKDQNGSNNKNNDNNDPTSNGGSNHSQQPSMPTFQPDPSKSAFITPNKNNEDFMLQQQQQQPLYDQPHDMKFGGGSGQGGGNMDYGFRNGMQSHNNSWDDTMNINYGPPPILAGPPTGMPPGIPTIRGRGQMNNFGAGQQFNMPGRQYQQQNQQQQQQQQTQNLYMMGRGMYGGGGWGSPSHNPMPPNMSPGGWGGCQPRGGGRMGNSIGGSQRNKIFGAYGHHQQGGNQYKERMGGGGGGPLDTMRSLEQFLPGDQPRGFMGPDSGPKGKGMMPQGLGGDDYNEEHGVFDASSSSGFFSSSRSSPKSQSGSAFDPNSERFSRKVFVGGLPPDIDEDEITASFRRFGPLVVDWPHKAESKSYFPPKGYAFLLFQDESSVQALIDACIQDDDKLYLCVSSPTIKDKPVQIRPWRLSDADFVLDASLPLDPRKTVFVGGVPRPLKAVELAMIMDRLYGGVCYAGIDTDPELKYPKGAGRVAFSNQQSYIAAISARFVQLQHGEIDKRVEVKPYVLDDQLCDECQGARCGGKFAPFFCANVTCLQYYCEQCWANIHSRPGREFHKPLVKEGADRPRTVPFRWC